MKKRIEHKLLKKKIGPTSFKRYLNFEYFYLTHQRQLKNKFRLERKKNSPNWQFRPLNWNLWSLGADVPTHPY